MKRGEAVAEDSLPYYDLSKDGWFDRIKPPSNLVLISWVLTAVFWGALVAFPKEEGGLAALGVIAMIIFVGLLCVPFTAFTDDLETALFLLAGTLVALVVGLIFFGTTKKQPAMVAAGGMLATSIAGYIGLFLSLGEAARFP